SGPELPKVMPAGLRPEEITVLRENIARREQAKEALRQEAIELGRSLDREAERTDRLAPRFNDVPPVFAADPPAPAPPAPRPPGGGGGGGWPPPRTLPGEQGGAPMPEQVARPGPGPTPGPEGWRPGEVERTGWDRSGGG